MTRIQTCALPISSTAGCAPAPKWNAEAEAKPFLQEMTFADQKSIRVLRFEAWEQRFTTLIFTTDKVDFDDPFVVEVDREFMSAELLVGLIEQVSEYRFKKPATKKTVLRGDFRGNKRGRIQVVQDGDHYVCYVVVLKPKPEDLPTAPSKK